MTPASPYRSVCKSQHPASASASARADAASEEQECVEDELGLYNAALSSSSSWSTVPSSPPLEDAHKALLDETTLCEESDEDENDTPPLLPPPLPLPPPSRSSISRHHQHQQHYQQHQYQHHSCHTGALLAPSCPVFEGGLLCGSFGGTSCEDYSYDGKTPAAATASIRLPQHHDWLVQDNAAATATADETVAPLPLFFTTRFRTLDAERTAQPDSDTLRVPHPEPDWYDMFAWLSLSSASTDDASSSSAKSSPLSWNGHLSLGPELPVNAKARRIKRKRRQMAAAFQNHNQAATSNSFSPIHQHHNHHAPSESESESQHTNESSTPTTPPPRVLRPLPIVPVNQPGHEDWEMVFLSNDDQSPSSSDSKGKHSARRAPTATTSMSIPAGVSPGKSDKHSSKHKSKGGSGMDLDTIAVRTPGADRSALKELPALRDAPPTKREELFILKLKLCSVIFSFDDPTADKRGKDMKRQTLLELVDYVNTPAGQKIFTESVMSDLMAMVSANVCRALPPATDDFDPEEDEPVLEPAWPHLQVAYEFFLRFIVSSEVNAKAAKKYVDQKFCLQLVELFDSEDPRERDYLKTILHRIYGKFMSHRSFIRRAISNVFYRFVYETERHNGIGELLEILGSIINGFAIPLKKEHLQFLVRALIPLHKPKCVALYHQQLSYCIIQYVEKDADTATPILNGFFKCWPWSSSAKQVMFLNELEEILELLGADQLAQVSTMLFTNLARCLDSDHFQVVERALFLWNNEHLVNSGCLSRLNAQTVLPIIYRPLYKNSAGHWNATVEGLAQNVLKMYMEYDLVLYDKCAKAYYREEEEAKRKLEALEAQWSAIEQTATTNMPALMAK